MNPARCPGSMARDEQYIEKSCPHKHLVLRGQPPIYRIGRLVVPLTCHHSEVIASDCTEVSDNIESAVDVSKS